MGTRRARVCEVCGRTYAPQNGTQRVCNRWCGKALRRAVTQPPKAPPTVEEPRFLLSGVRPACVGHDPELFFPPSVPPDEVLAICHRCPLLAQCREWSLRQPVTLLHGIWGGLTQHQRGAIVRRRVSA